MMSITFESFPWQRGPLSVQCSHCAIMSQFPLRLSPKDLSLLYCMYIYVNTTPTSKHMAHSCMLWSVCRRSEAYKEIPHAVIALVCTQWGFIVASMNSRETFMR